MKSNLKNFEGKEFDFVSIINSRLPPDIRVQFVENIMKFDEIQGGDSDGDTAVFTSVVSDKFVSCFDFFTKNIRIYTKIPKIFVFKYDQNT